MMTINQREALSVLEELVALSPDIRLGQLFAHLGFLGEAHLGHGLGEMEDDELVAILHRHRDEMSSRLTVTTSAPQQQTATSELVAADA